MKKKNFWCRWGFHDVRNYVRSSKMVATDLYFKGEPIFRKVEDDFMEGDCERCGEHQILEDSDEFGM